MKVFSRYARYYDAIYADKPYERECDVVESVVGRVLAPGPWRILDVGCGTGTHAVAFARRGHEVTGVDRSEEMLEIARAKAEGTVRFIQGNVLDMALGERFDVTTCLFGVLSYQLSAADALAALQSMRAHLSPGGVLVADFWHAPAVVAIGPTVREKVAVAGPLRVVRTAMPRNLDATAQTNTTSYIVKAFDGETQVDEVQEVHTVRFFFEEEATRCARMADFEVLQCFADWEPEVALHDRAWTAVLVALAI